MYSNQVSKTTESGEYITKGSFIIRGKKNYLSNVSMELGVTLYFQYGDNIDNMERNIVNDISTQSIVKQSINNEEKSSNIFGASSLCLIIFSIPLPNEANINAWGKSPKNVPKK